MCRLAYKKQDPMTINKITVINFGAIRFFETSLNEQLSVIETKYISELLKVFDIILCNKTVSSFPNNWVRSDTEIAAEVCIDNVVYYVNAKPSSSVSSKLSVYTTDVNGSEMTKQYLSLLSHCAEQDAIEHFDGCDKTLPLRLSWYHNSEDYKPCGKLGENSNHIATTKTFRSNLVKYIKSFKSEPINNKNKHSVTMRKNGRFEISHLESDKRFSITDEKMFLYICFLNIAKFWSNVETVRNLHKVDKPLLVKNFLEHLDESIEIEKLIKRSLILKRQIIFIMSCIEKEVKTWDISQILK